MYAISDTPKVVVGLDFGTTYSGFAFAHRADPDDVHLFFEWPKASRPYCKTQTSLFYSLANAGSDTYELQDWGWSALEKYTAALQSFRSECLNKQPFSSAGADIQRDVGVLVTQFKLLLAETETQSSFCGNLPATLTAEKLIVDYLRSMCDFTIAHVRQKYGKGFSKREVQWCLTVPAIWSERSKKKMQSYAEKAELVMGKDCSSVEASIYPLRIILEPEAASFYCQKQLRDHVSLNKGDKFIVADVGGGTIDIVVHKKAENACMNVHEVSTSSGELGGGTFVDRNFFQFLKEKIGCFHNFTEEDPETLLRILNWWLGQRGKSSFDGTGSKMLEVPRKLCKAWMKHDREMGLAARNEDDYDELEISEQAMKGMFDTEVQKAIELINKQLMSPDIKYIFLVGGFSESPYLVQEIKNSFKGVVEDVIAPPNPGGAICKGAVAIGFGTGVVLSRISKRWYGIRSSRLFRRHVDPPSYMVEDDDGIERCRNIFSVFVKKAESVLENKSVTHSFYPMERTQKWLAIDLISCTSDDKPNYTTDPGCEQMETYSLDINEDLHLGKDREVSVSMYFGRSSIEVSVQRVNFGENRATEKLYSVEFDAAGSYVNKDEDHALFVKSMTFIARPLLRNPSRSHGECFVKNSKLMTMQVESGAYKVMSERESLARRLKSCGNTKDVSEGKRVHARITGSEHHNDVYLANLVIQMYGKCGNVEDARRVFENLSQSNPFSWSILITAYTQNGHMQDAKTIFDKMPARDVVTWNTIISMYAQNGHTENAKGMFDRMPQRDVISWNGMVAAYAQKGYLEDAKSTFDRMPEWDVVSCTSMFNGYAQDGHLDKAKGMFDEMPSRNVVSWTAMVQAFADNGHPQESKSTFDMMPERNVVSWTAVVVAYAQSGDPQEARSIFDKMPKRNVVSWTGMLQAYAHEGCLVEAKSLFDEMPERNVVSWNVMFAAYAQNGDVEEAKNLLDRMAEHSEVSWHLMILAYAQNGHLEEAKSTFVSIPEKHVISWNAMISAYAQSGDVDGAKCIFDMIPVKDVFSWTAMLSAYAQNGQLKEAENLFHKIPEPNVVSRNVMVAMYAQSGHLQAARSTFDGMLEKNVVSWNAMLAAYAQSGHGKDALEFFHVMLLEAVQPTEVSFISILVACSRIGMVDRGRCYFVSMISDHLIKPSREHFCCMIDLVGRAGRLSDAEELISSMPLLPDDVAWGTLLSACRTYNDTERGRRASKHVVDLDPQNAGAYYVLLSNTYAAVGKQEQVSILRKAMGDGNVRKPPGLSMIEQHHVENVGGDNSCSTLS